MLFGCYRRGDANDPDTYVAAIAAVLSLYDTDLIREVTDPRTGIQTAEKHIAFMPNPGELKAHCEAIVAHRQRVARLAAVPAPAPRLIPPEVDGRLANVHLPHDNPRYAAMCVWAKTADRKWWKFGKSSIGKDGIWVPLNVLHGDTILDPTLGDVAVATVKMLHEDAA